MNRSRRTALVSLLAHDSLLSCHRLSRYLANEGNAEPSSWEKAYV